MHVDFCFQFVSASHLTPIQQLLFNDDEPKKSMKQIANDLINARALTVSWTLSTTFSIQTVPLYSWLGWEFTRKR